MGRCNLTGPDGKRINFGDDASPEYLGTLADENPWEVLHRIRFGLPAVGMPALSLSTLSISDQADILAYTPTLPAK